MTTTESVTTLTIDARGIVVEIPDSKGELRSYEAKRSPDGFDTYAVTLRRLDGDGDTHRVSLDPRGWWECTCGYWRHKARKKGCKHTRCVQDIRKLVEALA